MRHHITAAALLTLAATLTACSGSDTVTTEPAKTSAAATDAAKTKASPTPSKQATVGDTVTLHGTDDGAKLDVTLVKWVDPAKSSDEYTSPEKGNRWVAVQLRITNTGSAVYSDSPENGMQVADTDGQQFQPTYADITAGPAMSSSVKLTPGSKALGWTVFEVPKGSKIETLQFAMDSGFADETGQWTIK